jgi:GH15 family glucan-1,4-alpha-glucosidase
MMCWAACDRLGRIAARLSLDGRRDHWQLHAEKIRKGIMQRAWNSELNSFAATFDGSDVDATLLLIHNIGFLPATDPRILGTLAAVERRLRDGSVLFRYAAEDDFGRPTNAFVACTFWYIDALAAAGRQEEARALFEQMVGRRSSLGMLSEDFDIAAGEHWGNFPQTFSMVGIIHSAMRLSKSWEGAF